MEHQHHHDHHHEITSLNKAFIIGITLNLLFVVTEFLAGFWFNSLGLVGCRAQFGRCSQPCPGYAGFSVGKSASDFQLYLRI